MTTEVGTYVLDIDWVGGDATRRHVQEIADRLRVTLVDGNGFPATNLVVRGSWVNIRIWLYQSGYMNGMDVEQQMEVISWIEPAS